MYIIYTYYPYTIYICVMICIYYLFLKKMYSIQINIYGIIYLGTIMLFTK